MFCIQPPAADMATSQDRHVMPFNASTRVVTTTDLMELNRMATRFGATRVLDPYEMLNLDQEGLHFLTHIFLFWHPFRRCEVALKMQGDPHPHYATLDLQDEWYDPLLTLEQYREAIEYYETHPRRAHG
jgi:hypothetical protein